MSGEWTLYHDGRLESGIRYLSADAYEMKEYQVSEADMQRIQELLKEILWNPYREKKLVICGV